MSNFALDSPQVIEAPLESTSQYTLGNQDVSLQADARANLTDFTWPWANSHYAKSIAVTIRAPREDDLVPMVSHLYPGYMETILGTHSMDGGIIVSKQLAVPLGSSYDRSAIWLLSCQAEGDRLLQVDVDIDWGEALEQQMVDGLLLAQKNPGSPQGIYEQRNADSTRVFGNPEGRPHQVELDDPRRARLVYYVLVNGEVDFQFLLTVSDVGEQVAWNGFLALRDATRVVEKSGNAWRDYLKAGRLWTPDAELNFTLNASKIVAIQSMLRLRSGMVPVSRAVKDVPALSCAWNVFEPIQCRNLLAHLRRLAEKSNGRLPEYFSLRRKDLPDDPGLNVNKTNSAYLIALAEYLTHRFDDELLAAHYPAIGLCAEGIARNADDPSRRHGLSAAAFLAMLHGDKDNSRKWHQLAQKSDDARQELKQAVDLASQTEKLSAKAGWASNSEGVWSFKQRLDAAMISGEAIWRHLGLNLDSKTIKVQPAWQGSEIEPWQWWAFMDLPLVDDRTLSLVWDGTALHANQSVQSDLPVVQHHAIRTTGTDEDSFALEFVFIDKIEDGGETKKSFRPELTLLS